MAFINRKDIIASIPESIIKNYDSILATHIARAESQAFSYLNGIYDVKEIVKKTDDDRESYLVQVIVDLCIYHVLNNASHREVPISRRTNYEDALRWLIDLSEDKIQAPDDDKMPRKVVDDKTVTPVLFSSDKIGKYKI